MKLSVIVPVYNERKTVAQLLRLIRKERVEGVELEVIVVDDGSEDGSLAAIEADKALYDVLLKNERNLGKGAAVREGLRAATGEYVLIQDADLEYSPSEYAGLLHPVKAFGADVVIGSRFMAPRWTRVSYFWHKVGNILITLWFNLWYNTTWTDVYSCHILLRRDLVAPDELRTSGWQQQAEILAKACRRATRLYEVPISYSGRSYEDGKKIKWYHVAGILLTIAKSRVI
jgi:glycosyltransferase involved in cell wall biosynthesis